MLQLLFFLGMLLTTSIEGGAKEMTWEEIEQKLKEEEISVNERSAQIAKFYEMDPEQDIRDITEEVLSSSVVKAAQKKEIKTAGRRIFVFNYPSDGHKVKGYISFIPGPDQKQLLVSLRGGNRLFALPNPGSDISCMKDYTILATTYRGGVSEGTDEYGGGDVNDVKNLVNYIPVLEEKLGQKFKTEGMYMLGGSRGGMQLFLALARFPELQDKVSKIVSLSGLLDMELTVAERLDLVEMFTEDYGLRLGENDTDWVKLRNPLAATETLRKDLPILIIQGGQDLRVSLAEGLTMVQKLKEQGNTVYYWEFSDGDHCLGNREDRVELLLKWFEQD